MAIFQFTLASFIFSHAAKILQVFHTILPVQNLATKRRRIKIVVRFDDLRSNVVSLARFCMHAKFFSRNYKTVVILVHRKVSSSKPACVLEHGNEGKRAKKILVGVEIAILS